MSLRRTSWVVALSICVSISGCTLFKKSPESALKRIKAEKILRIAIDPTYAPMEFDGPDGKPTGFDVELGVAIAQEMGVSAKFITMSWEGILTGLVSGGRYDVIMSSMNITQERLKQVNFVKYLEMSQVFVSRTTGKHVKTTADLSDKIVAVQADTTSHSAVQSAQKKGVKIKKIKAFQKATDVFQAVRVGQADVIVIDEPVGLYHANKDPKTFKVTGHAIAPEPVGIAIRKNAKALKKAIESAVSKLKSDGTFKRISHKWFGTELGKL